MTSLVLPSAQSLSPVELRAYSQKIVEWAEATTDLDEVRDLSNKWAAITEYVRRTSKEGVADAEAAQRRLEVRVGQLLGPAETGGRGKASITTDSFTRNARSDLRQLADNPDVVEQVIAESDDDSPPSRRKVLNAIRETAPTARRNPLPQQSNDAAWTLRKATERLERIFADDRFGANKEQVATHTRGHLLYVVDVCQDLIDQLDNQGDGSQ